MVAGIRSNFTLSSLHPANGATLRKYILYDYHTPISLCTYYVNEVDVSSKDQTAFVQLLGKHDIPAFSSRSSQYEPWMMPRLFAALPDFAIGA
jgi:hypothetical protein